MNELGKLTATTVALVLATFPGCATRKHKVNNHLSDSNTSREIECTFDYRTANVKIPDSVTIWNKINGSMVATERISGRVDITVIESKSIKVNKLTYVGIQYEKNGDYSIQYMTDSDLLRFKPINKH
jgi:hypothetical protein